MTAVASDDERTVLLLLPSRMVMYPLNTAALTRAQNSRRKLSSEYRNALILDRDGTLRRIERIDVLGPWGHSLARKFLSRLTDAWSIRVHLSLPQPQSLDQIKLLLVECLASPRSLENLQLDGERARAELIASIHKAASAEELLEVLKLPMPEDVLDVL